MKDRIDDAVETARPYAERLAHDEDLHEHVKSAYASARRVYDDLIGPTGATGMAFKVARDKDLQEDLKKIVDDLREAGKHARGETSHSGRNFTLLMIGIAIGVLFNPLTGPETRKWVKEKVFGPEEPFESYSNSSTNQS